MSRRTIFTIAFISIFAILVISGGIYYVISSSKNDSPTAQGKPSSDPVTSPATPLVVHHDSKAKSQEAPAPQTEGQATNDKKKAQATLKFFKGPEIPDGVLKFNIAVKDGASFKVLPHHYYYYGGLYEDGNANKQLLVFNKKTHHEVTFGTLASEGYHYFLIRPKKDSTDPSEFVLEIDRELFCTSVSPGVDGIFKSGTDVEPFRIVDLEVLSKENSDAFVKSVN